MTKYRLIGKCSQCGDCCRFPFIDKIMCQNKNLIDGDLYCDFIEKRIDGKFYCSMIVERLKTDPTFTISKTLDPAVITSAMRTELDMTDKQTEWCCRTINFPDPNNKLIRKMLANKKKYGFGNCTFSFEEVV